MIHSVLKFFKKQLNEAFRNQFGVNEDMVVYLGADQLEMADLQKDRVSLAMINVEEERKIKSYPSRPNLPNIYLYLYLLFVCRFSNYEDSGKYLSCTINFFQKNNTFERTSYPNLGEGLNKLVAEMITLPLSEQDHIWNALRTSYQPSVLYRIKLITFKEETVVTSERISGLDTSLKKEDQPQLHR